MCCPERAHALLLSTSLWQPEVNHSGKIYTVEIGRHLSEFLFWRTIVLHFTGPNTWTEYSQQWYLSWPKLGTPWIFRHSRRINTLWHFFFPHQNFAARRTDTHYHIWMNEWMDGWISQTQNNLPLKVSLCKFQNQAKLSGVRGYESGRGCAGHVWKRAPVGHWGGGRKYSAPTSELWLLGCVNLVKKLIELTWSYIFLQV